MSEDEYEPEVSNVGQSAPVEALRFVARDGKKILQFATKVTVYHDGEPWSQGFEWQDVPLETEE